MIEKIIIFAIIGLSAFFIGKRFYYQWKSALSKDERGVACCSGCSGCSVSEDPADKK